METLDFNRLAIRGRLIIIILLLTQVSNERMKERATVVVIRQVQQILTLFHCHQKKKSNKF